MTKVTVRQVVGAVRRVRGRRGARLRDVVDCVVEQTHLRAVGRALRGLVRSGVLRQQGHYYRLAPSHSSTTQAGATRYRGRQSRKGRRRGRRRSHRVNSASSLEHIRQPVSCNTLVGSSSSWSSSRTSTGCNICRKQRSSSACSRSRGGSLEHIRQPRSCYTLVGSAPASRRSSRSTSRTCTGCNICCKDRSSSSGSSDSDLTVNPRLASTRDSVEVLKERLSNKSTQVSGSSGGGGASDGADIAAPISFHWLNQNRAATSLDTLAHPGADQETSLDTLPPSPATGTKFPYFPWN